MFLSRLAAWHPEEVLSNEELGRMVDTTDEWIVEHVGIRTRRRAPREMPVHELGARAARLALEGVDPASIDLVLCAHSISDYQIPATANLVAAEVGCGDAAAFDIKAACSSFVFALHALRGLMATGGHRRALLVIPEMYTHATDYEDRATCILWGDAGFACIATADRPEGFSLEVRDTLIGSRSKDWAAVKIPTGGFFGQQGTVVQAFAVRKMTELIGTVLERNGLSKGDVDWLVGHQANLGILERVARRAEIPWEKNLVNIVDYGNTGAAGAPTAIAQNVSRIRDGHRIVVATVGSGLSWGGALLVGRCEGGDR